MQQPDQLPAWLPAHRSEAVRRLLAAANVQFISAWYWRNRAPWEVPWRRVMDSFFLFPTVGTVTVELTGQRLRLKPGQVLLLADGVPHRLELAPPQRRLEQIAVHCHLTNAWNLPLLSLFPQPVVRLPAGVDWHEQLRRLTCEAGHDPRLGQLRADLLIKQLLVALVEAGAELRWPAAAADPRLATALQAIHDRYATDLSVGDLARLTGLSETQFRKRFRQATGSGPREFLVHHRLRTAAHLLETTALTVKEIAGRVGFRSDHYFHASFRAAYGSTPSAHRRIFHEGHRPI